MACDRDLDLGEHVLIRIAPGRAVGEIRDDGYIGIILVGPKMPISYLSSSGFAMAVSYNLRS
jgi:hypothetical protein